MKKKTERRFTPMNNMKHFIETMNKYPVTNIHEVNQSLEEIFLHFYGGDRS